MKKKKIRVDFENGAPSVYIEQSYQFLAMLRPNVVWKWDTSFNMSNEDVFILKKDRHYYYEVTKYYASLNGIEFTKGFIPNFVNPVDEEHTTLFNYLEEVNPGVPRSVPVEYERTHLRRIVANPKTRIFKFLKTVCMYFTQDYDKHLNNKLYILPQEELEAHVKEMVDALKAWKYVLKEFKNA